MKCQYDVVSGRQLQERTHCVTTEIWLVLQGQLHLTVDRTEYTVSSGELVRLYEGCDYALRELSPSMVGRILVSDYRETALRVWHHSSPSQVNLMRCVFLLALDLQSQPLNTKDRIMSAIDHLVRAVRLELLSQDNPKSEAISKINTVIEQIHAQYADPNFDLSEVIAHTNYNINYFIKIFRERIGLSPHQFLIQYRIDTSKERMRNAGGNIAVQLLAEQCGFSDAAYFSRQFRLHEGISPSEYMEQIISQSDR